MWDGEWAYHVKRSIEAPAGSTMVSLTQLNERFEELGLAHTTVLDKINSWVADRRKIISPDNAAPYGYRGLFAYPPQRKVI